MIALAILAALAAPPTQDETVRYVWEAGVGQSVVYQGAEQGTEAAALTVAETTDAISGACWRPVPTLHRFWVWEPSGWRLVRVRGVPVLVNVGTGECEWKYQVMGEGG